jgi:6-phosphofructokinase 1
MKRIAVLTSGGDAAGMNAAVRAVVRGAISQGGEVFGVHNGYAGLIDDDFVPLGARDVGGIIQTGGTFLGSARSLEFQTDGGRAQALGNLARRGIEGLVVIGGNGSQIGAAALSSTGFPVVGVASTIDNDLFGSDICIGVDTALNIAIEAIDRLKTTASSLHRAFVIEVMGRECGYLAMMAGIAGGAEAVVIPEVDVDPEALAGEIRSAYGRGKPHAIVVVAEGAKCNGLALVHHFEKDDLGFELRLTILGHVQRGGAPTAADRLLGTRLGYEAAIHLLRGASGVLVGIKAGEVVTTPLSEVAANRKALDPLLLHLAGIMAL